MKPAVFFLAWLGLASAATAQVLPSEPVAINVIAWHDGQTRDSRSVVVPPQRGVAEQDFPVR
jgi:hypothetical protein